MSDAPGRRTYDPSEGDFGSDDRGWGSPVPAEYGALWPQRSPVADSSAQPADAADGAASWSLRRSRRRRGSQPEPSPIQQDGEGTAVPSARAPSQAAIPDPQRNGSNGVTTGELALGMAAGGAATASAAQPMSQPWPDQSADYPSGVHPPQGLGRVGGRQQSYDTAEYEAVNFDGPNYEAAALAAAGMGAANFDRGDVDVDGLRGGATTVSPLYDPGPTYLGLPPLPGPRLDGLTRRQRKAARRAMRSRSRATVRHIDVLTVLRVSVVFYVVVLAIFVVASVLLYYAADTFGTLPSLEKSVRTLFSLKSFVVHPGQVAEYTSGAGLIIAVVGTLANVLLALIYNLIAEVVGGVRIEVDAYPSE